MEVIARFKGLHWVPGWSMTGVWGLEDPLASRERRGLAGGRGDSRWALGNASLCLTMSQIVVLMCGMGQKMRTDNNTKGSAFVEFRAMTPQSSRYNKRRASLSGLLKEVLVRWQRWSRRSML